MAEKTWRFGQEGWTSEGYLARFVAYTDAGRAVVQLAVDGEDGHWGPALITSRLYESPPEGIFDEKIAKRRDELRELGRQILVLQRDLQDAKAERGRLLEKLKTVPALRRIEECMDGKITHWVVNRYEEWKVLTHEEALETREGWEKKMKLVTLYGDPRRVDSFEYRINEYSDGSGGSRSSAWPFCSEEEANAFAVSELQQILAGFADQEDLSDYRLPRIVESAQRFRVEVPPRITDYLREREIKAARADVARQQERLDAAKAALASVQAAAAQEAKP